MVPGSRSKSRKNINPRRREEGYVLTRVVNPTQPNPRVVRRRSSVVVVVVQERENGWREISRIQIHRIQIHRDCTPTRRRACPPFRSPPRSRSIERSRHHPRNPGGGSSRCARASNARTPAGGDALAGKKEKVYSPPSPEVYSHRRRRRRQSFSFSSFPPLPQDRARRGFQRAGSPPTVASPSIPPWFVSHHVSSS